MLLLQNFNTVFLLNKLNLAFLFVFLLIGAIFYLFSNALSYSPLNTKLTLIKNYVLSVYTISFILFMFFIKNIYFYKNLFSISTIFFKNDLEFNINCYDSCALVIIYLCYLVGFISLFTLSDRFWSNNYGLPLTFLYFPLVINLLVQSSAIFELFFYYELLLLPSIFFVYKSGYTRKSQQANIYFFVWTQLGSLIVLVGIVYLSMVTGCTTFKQISSFKLTQNELYTLYITFFFGFGVKVPVWPLHYWLIKVHVEAPSGFSIFLSGFLVKTAVYSFYKITLLLNPTTWYVLPFIFCLMGMLDSSLKMWSQVDIKKLIAYATVQEMNAIFLLFNFVDNYALSVGVVFLLAHGVLSSLMFFLIECIYRRTQSRSIYKVSGLSVLYPNLGVAIWAMLILFFGFPGTLKFYAEFQLILILAEVDLLFSFFVIFIFIFVNSVGFARCWFSILYGHPGYPKPKMDLSKEETVVIIFLVFLSFFLSFFVYLI